MVSNHIWSPCVLVSDCDFVATGLAIVNTNNVSIRGNTVGRSQCGICLGPPKPPTGEDDQVNDSQVIGNTVFDTDVFDGIALTGDNNRVTSNTITNSDSSGIFLNGDDNSILRNNINTAPICVLETTGSEGNVIRANQCVNTPTLLQDTARKAKDTAETAAGPAPVVDAFR
ncbi:MAG: right-handed parallel beta-helix repeat-containing protein [Acidobacteria bacterium]|nr:right-handed parallel beta-helix repeat-containing protein [Acidobacteriota bacterium]